jgi:hypothetical protein
VKQSRSPLMWVLSFAAATTVTAARPAVATAQDISTIAMPAAEPGEDLESLAPGLDALAHAEDRIAFGVRRGAIQHVVARSPFEEAYDADDRPSGDVAIVTVHRFGQRARGTVQLLSRETPAPPLAPPEEPLQLGPHAPVMWNLSDHFRIAFGGRARPAAIDPALEHATAPIGSIAIEFGDRR